jgi:hypothetical protein
MLICLDQRFPTCGTCTINGTRTAYRWYAETLFVAFFLVMFNQEVGFGGTQVDKNTRRWYVKFFMLL